jgi:hypothetical protein
VRYNDGSALPPMDGILCSGPARWRAGIPSCPGYGCRRLQPGHRSGRMGFDLRHSIYRERPRLDCGRFRELPVAHFAWRPFGDYRRTANIHFIRRPRPDQCTDAGRRHTRHCAGASDHTAGAELSRCGHAAASCAATVHKDGGRRDLRGRGARRLLAGGAKPCALGEIIVLYGTGFGPTSPEIPISQAHFQPAILTTPMNVTVGGAAAHVQWAGLIGLSRQSARNLQCRRHALKTRLSVSAEQSGQGSRIGPKKFRRFSASSRPSSRTSAVVGQYRAMQREPVGIIGNASNVESATCGSVCTAKASNPPLSARFNRLSAHVLYSFRVLGDYSKSTRGRVRTRPALFPIAQCRRWETKFGRELRLA